MTTPTSKPFGRSLSDFGELLPAEKQLRDAVRLGEPAVFGEVRPSECTPNNEIRAEFLRFLALGGDKHAPVHERGIQVFGAWISGKLNINAAEINGNFKVCDSKFNTAPVFSDAHIRGSLKLTGSLLPGLDGDRLTVHGGVFLDGKFIATGKICFLGAQIDGDFNCQGGQFKNEKNDALVLNRANVKGKVFLSGKFIAEGTVSLKGVRIGSNLECNGGQFSCKYGDAISATQAHIQSEFIFKQSKSPVLGINLNGAWVGTLNDDESSWGGNLQLDGFIYDHLAAEAPNSAHARLSWLKKQRGKHFKPQPWKQLLGRLIPTWHRLQIYYQQGQLIRTLLRVRNLRKLRQIRNNFKPHPWKQLIRTLRKMGHEEEARLVAITYETHRRQHKIIHSRVSRAFHWLFGLFIAYGYRPLRLFFIMMVIWLFCAGMYWTAALHDVFAPGNPLVFNHPNYQHCSPGYQPKNAGDKAKFGNWYLCPQLAGEYTGFSPLAYSLDLILPLVDLQQEHDWAPYIPTPKATWHEELLQFFHPEDWKYHWTRLLVWFEILFGWVASLLLVAVVSGLTNRDKEE